MKNATSSSQKPDVWSEILSQDPAKINSAFSFLQPDEKTALIAHLNRMVSEEGYHPEQIISAQFALNVLQIGIKD